MREIPGAVLAGSLWLAPKFDSAGPPPRRSCGRHRAPGPGERTARAAARLLAHLLAPAALLAAFLAGYGSG